VGVLLEVRIFGPALWLMLIVVGLSSFTVSYSILVAESARRALEVAVGSGGGVAVVYDGGSRFLLTGLVPVESKRILNATVASPEVLVPVVVSGSRIVMLRGIDPSNFSMLEQVSVAVSGREWVVVGAELARVLRVNVGDTLLIQSGLNSRVLVLKVVGFIEKSPFSSELLASIEDAQLLRGCGPGFVSIIRFRGEARLRGSGEGGYLPPAWLVRAVLSGKVSASPVGEVASRYSDAFGLSRSAVGVVSALALAVSSLAVFAAGYMGVLVRRSELSVFRLLGASRHWIFSRLVRNLGLVFLFSCLVGGILGAVFVSSLSLLFHPVEPRLYYLLVLLVLPVVWGVGVWTGLKALER